MMDDVIILTPAQQRRHRLRRETSFVLDLLVVCLEAGLGLDQSLTIIAQRQRGLFAIELRKALDGLSAGQSHAMALRELADRLQVPEFNRVVDTIVNAQRTGGPLGTYLREHAKDLRRKRMLNAQSRARIAVVALRFPMICCFLPAFLVALLAPEVMLMLKAWDAIMKIIP